MLDQVKRTLFGPMILSACMASVFIGNCSISCTACDSSDEIGMPFFDFFALVVPDDDDNDDDDAASARSEARLGSSTSGST